MWLTTLSFFRTMNDLLKTKKKLQNCMWEFVVIIFDKK